MDTVMECKACRRPTGSALTLTPDLPHYGKLQCEVCGAFRGWAPKPDSDPSKYRRPVSHRELVARYSRGFCELCLKTESQMERRSVLEAHHVLEFHEGGEATRENIWILCTACHRLVTWMRKYVGNNEPMTGLVAEVAKELTKDAEAGSDPR